MTYTPIPEHIIAFVNTADALIADGADATTESFAVAVLAAVGPLIYEHGYSDGTMSLIRKNQEMYLAGRRDALNEAAEWYYNAEGEDPPWLRTRADALEAD